MKKSIKSISALILCSSLVLTSAACLKKKAKKAEKVVQETDTYYRAESIELALPDIDPELEIMSAMIGNSYVLSSAVVASYAFEYVMPQELADRYQSYIMNPMVLSDEDAAALLEEVNRYTQSGLIVYNLDGNVRCNIPDGDPGSSMIARVFDGNNGEILALREDFGEAPDWNMTYSVAKITDSGELVDPIDLENVNTMFHEISTTEDGGFVCTGYQEVVFFDANGNLLAEDKNTYDNSVLQNVFHQNGNYYGTFDDFSSPEFTTSYIRKLDTTTGEFSLEHTELRNLGLVQGNDGVYYLEGNNVEKIDLESCQTEKILFSWNDVDVNRKSISSFYLHSDDEIYFVSEHATTADPYFEMNGISQPFLVKLTKQEKNPHAGKSIIEIASYRNYSYIPDVILDRIVEYNLDPENKTRIQFVDYSSISTPFPPMDTDEETQISQTVDKIYLDLMAGAGPDILLGFGEFSQLDNEKILVDLNTMIDGENGLNREEYFDNVLRACEKDGHLYQFPINFIASGMAANSKYTNGKTLWSYDDFQSIISSLPNNMTIIPETNWSDVMSAFLYGEGRKFIDYENKAVHFDDPEFLKILEIAKQIGSMRTAEEIENSDLEGYYMGTDLGLYCLDQEMSASSFCRLIHILEFAQYESACNNGVTFIGYPGNENGGLSAEHNLSIGISRSSSYQKEAWEFIRFLLDKDTQVECAHLIYGFPIRKDACETLLLKQVGSYEKAKATANVGYIRDLLESYPVLDKDTVARAMTMLENIHSVLSFDKTVFLLIKEEAEGYILGSRSAEDVAKNIQNRTATVITERG